MGLLAVMLTVVFCGIVTILIGIVFAIARFYQVTSGQVSHYRWFLAPMILLAAGAVRYAWIGDYLGDAVGDLFMLAGGLSLMALCLWLVRLMMGGRRR